MLHLILQMISVTDRIDLKTARFKFDSLRSVPKIQLPDNLINEIDNIINKNTGKNGKQLENYSDVIALREIQSLKPL